MAFLARAREDARKVRDSGSGSTPPSSKESGGLRHSGRDVPKEGKVERSGSGSASSSPASMKTKTMSPPAVAIPRAPSSNLKGEAPPNAFVEEEAIWEQDPSQAGSNRLYAATVEFLIELAIDDTRPGSQDYTRVILLTVHLWSSPLALLEGMAVRARGMLSKLHSPQEEVVAFAKRRLLRIVVLFKYWMQNHWARDFAGDENLPFLRRFETVVKEDLVPVVGPATALLTLLSQMRSGKVLLSEPMPPAIPPPLIADADIGPLLARSRFTQIPPKEFARQLSLKEHARLTRISMNEFCNQAWLKPNRETLAPAIAESIRYFNQLSEWATSEVLQVPDLAARVSTIEWMIDVTKETWALNNFSSTLQMFSALGRPPVQRLKDTWKAVSPDRLKDFEQFGERFSPLQNWRVLREHLTKAIPPVIPYLGVFLTDIVMLEEGNAATLPGKSGTPLINYDRYRRFGDLLSQLELYQNTPYHLTPLPSIATFLTQLKSLPDRKMYELSELIQPRNKGTQEGVDAQTESKVQHTVSMLRLALNAQLEDAMPGIQIQTWKGRTAAGEVYLWSEDLTVEYVKLPDGALYILAFQLALSKAALATLVRTAHAFCHAHLNPVTVRAVMAVAEAGDPELLTAFQSGVDVLVVDLSNRQSPIASVHPAAAAIASHPQYARNFLEWLPLLQACGVESTIATEGARRLTESARRLSEAATLDRLTLDNMGVSASLLRAFATHLPTLTIVSNDTPPVGVCPFRAPGESRRSVIVEALLEKPEPSSSSWLLQATLVSLNPNAPPAP